MVQKTPTILNAWGNPQWVWIKSEGALLFSGTTWIFTRVLITVVQAFLDFRDFPFNVIYNSILFSSLLVLLSNLDLRGFCFRIFFLESPH